MVIQSSKIWISRESLALAKIMHDVNASFFVYIFRSPSDWLISDQFGSNKKILSLVVFEFFLKHSDRATATVHCSVPHVFVFRILGKTSAPTLLRPTFPQFSSFLCAFRLFFSTIFHFFSHLKVRNPKLVYF